MNKINSLMYTLAAGAFTFMITVGFGKVIESVQ